MALRVCPWSEVLRRAWCACPGVARACTFAFALACAAAIAVAVARAGAAEPSDDDDALPAALGPPTAAESELRALVEQGVHPDLAWSEFTALQPEIAAFYARRGWAAAWFDGSEPTPQARAMAALLAGADRKGLDADDYDGPRWPDRLDLLTREHGGVRGATPRAIARADVALTVSVARFATDLRSGRIDPRRVRFDLPVDRDSPRPAELIALLAGAPDVRAAAESLEPRLEPYRRTRAAFERAMERAAAGGPESAVAAREAAQLRLTLERWRWLPRRLPSPPVVVNIPEFRLHAGDPAHPLELRVVVGRSLAPYRTPVFAAEIEAVQFRPWWNVPRSIASKELVPKIARAPATMQREDYELVDRAGHVVAPSSQALQALSAGALRIRQRPGPKNALGLVKFVMPNRYDVYLHGTPAVKLFERSKRDASHGCIRVDHPEQLAAWVLRDEPGDWTLERVEAAMDGERSFAVQLTRKVPVLVMYATATVDEAGAVRLSPDLYGHDAALERALGERRRTARAASERPVADRSGVDVDEVRGRVVADASAAQ